MLWHRETGDEDALASAVRIADLLCQTYLGDKKPRLVDTGSTEMNLAPVHALCILYRKTTDERYLKLALQIVEEFTARSEDGEPLAGDYLQQALQNREFYQMPKPRWESLHPIMALAELYWITGEDQYRQAFEHIWWSIVKFDRHNNGGFSSGEKATGNPITADELELTLFNSIVGMFSSAGRWATYNTPMNGVRRASAHTIVFQAREGSPELNCCSVNAPRGFGMLSDWALMQDHEGLVLNYYGSSTLKATLKPGLSVKLTQRTIYPLDGQIAIHVEPTTTSAFTLKLRIPHWSAKTSVSLNGEAVPTVKAGRYLTIEREWKVGDRIDIALDMSLHFWRGARECEGRASVYRGPILLAYDHRYNLENTKKGDLQIRNIEEWEPTTCILDIPPLDARTMTAKPVPWSDWLPPLLLLEFEATDGRIVRLCDFGSAGEVGTPYCSWLPIKHCPPTATFSRENPLRSVRI
jgi:hypothetical protein